MFEQAEITANHKDTSDREREGNYFSEDGQRNFQKLKIS